MTKITAKLETFYLLKFLFKKLKSGYFDKYETVCIEGPKFEFQRSILSYSLERTMASNLQNLDFLIYNENYLTTFDQYVILTENFQKSGI